MKSAKNGINQLAQESAAPKHQKEQAECAHGIVNLEAFRLAARCRNT